MNVGFDICQTFVLFVLIDPRMGFAQGCTQTKMTTFYYPLTLLDFNVDDYF